MKHPLISNKDFEGDAFVARLQVASSYKLRAMGTPEYWLRRSPTGILEAHDLNKVNRRLQRGPFITTSISKVSDPEVTVLPLDTPRLFERFLETESQKSKILEFASQFGMLGRNVVKLKSSIRREILLGESINCWKFQFKRMRLFESIAKIGNGDTTQGKIQDFVQLQNHGDRIEVNWKESWSKSKLLQTVEPWGVEVSHEVLKKKYRITGLDNKSQSRLLEKGALTLLERELQAEFAEGCFPLLAGGSPYSIRLQAKDLQAAIYLSFFQSMFGIVATRRKCIRCSNSIEDPRSNKLYCSEACRKALQAKRRRDRQKLSSVKDWLGG